MMFKTEAQARACWCPFARGIMDQGGNRMSFGGADDATDSQQPAVEYAAEMANLYPCIASQCMAWRFAEVARAAYGREEPAAPQDRVGYCGLAGHPAPMFAVDAGGPRP